MGDSSESKAAPASTGWLILSIFFANKLWISDATSMSLYWVARLPIPRTPFRSPLAPKTNGHADIQIAPKISTRSRKIALSFAIVGALASPFAFGTYKARPTYSVWVSLTPEQMANRSAYLRSNDCRIGTDDVITRIVCDRVREEYELGGNYEYYPDLPRYLMLNGGVTIAMFAGVFVLALLVPMLVRSFTHLLRRYLQWLNA
jgi:hypothetical protein